MTLKFNEADAFLREVENDKPDAVRLVFNFKASSVTPNIQHVTIVGTYPRDGYIVRYDEYIGDVMRGLDTPSHEKTHERGEKLRTRIINSCNSLGISVLGGIWEEN